MIINNIKKILKEPYIQILNLKNKIVFENRYDKKNILDKKIKFVKGSFEKNHDYDDAWLFFLSLKSKIIFDVGCHTGSSSLLATYFDSVKKIILIEPNPVSLSTACENLIINNKSEDAIFIPKAAYNTIGKKIKLWSMQGAYAGASLNINFTETGSITKSYFETETITLDNIADTHNYYRDLVKIDVEGSENYVLEGATNIAKKANTLFLVEVHSTNTISIVDNTNKILSWASKNNYCSYYLCEHKKMINSQCIEKRGRYHLLLLPIGKKYPSGLKKIRQGANIDKMLFDN